MSCVTEIAKELSNCEVIPLSGYEHIAWAFTQQRATFTFGVLPLITNISLLGAFAYEVETVKKEMNGGFDCTRKDDGDEFSHFFSIQPYERTASAIVNMDSMNGIVVVAEKKGSKVEGCFVAYGVGVGMYRKAASWRGSSTIPVYEFGTPDKLSERYSRFVIWDTDYETTKSMLDELSTTTRLTGMDGSGLIGMDGSELIGKE